jgi:hypothetical protein
MTKRRKAVRVRQDQSFKGRQFTSVRGPANSPPKAGSIRHLRPANSPPLAAGTEPLGEAEPPLTNNFIW